MAAITNRLRDFLDHRAIPYQTLDHDKDFTARETAAHTHTPEWEFAKTVFIQIDGKDAMAVLPAHHKIDLGEFEEALGAKSVILTDEVRTRELCPDCDLGAAPPFGNLYDLPVYLSTALEWDEHITFNGGNHASAVRMNLDDFDNTVKPTHLRFSAKT